MGTPLNHSDNKKTKKPQTPHSLFSPLANERGVTAMVMALVLIVLVAMASFAIDLGFAWVTKNELQNIADGASLAGGRQLGLVYEGLSEADKQDLTRSLTSAEEARIVAAVMTVAGLNRAGGKQGITIDTANDVTMGTWDFASQTFTPTVVRPTAVTVTARRDNNANGAIATVFAKVMGYNEINISATAVAALGPLGSIPPGEATLPVGISKRWFDEGRQCGDYIKFHPTGDLDGCAGWHTYTEGPANASDLRKILVGLSNDTYTSPEVTAGQTQLEFTGGTVGSIFDEMKALYDTKKDANGEWEVTIPVYDSDDCSNPSGAITIVGFVRAKVTQVIEMPEKQIIAQVICDEIEQGRPGGAMGAGGFSPLSTIPALVS